MKQLKTLIGNIVKLFSLLQNAQLVQQFQGKVIRLKVTIKGENKEGCNEGSPKRLQLILKAENKSIY